MQEQRLLASAALMRELYDNNKDIYDVVSEFIRASILLNSRWTFNATECTKDIKKTFGFNLPQAVINTCLKKRLKKSGELSLDRGTYNVADDFDRNKSINSSLDTLQNEYNEIINNLISHVRSLSAIDVNDDTLKYSFNEYILNNKASGEYVNYINHYLLKHQFDEGFKERLNKIEEGLVLYSGIKYSPDLSSLGHWDSDLIIFLDTEHLFSATGLNGVLYKKIFDDFKSLVEEINSKKGNRGKIKLQYFKEICAEVDRFFYAAEKSVENHKQIDPSKTAMVSITNGCNSGSDVLAKKADFLNSLRKLKIEIEDNKNYYEDPTFNIESQESINTLKEKFNHIENEGVYAEILKIFTKINCIRKGQSKCGIDRVSAIFMTENWLTQRVAFSDVAYCGDGCVPFATNIEFLTERMWFKLNKGFGDNSNVPASFDVITKAKLVLSSQVNNRVSETFNNLKKKYDRGEINEESTAILIAQLRKKSSYPEDFSDEIIDDSLEFMDDNFIESMLREKTILEDKSKEGEKAIARLKKLERENNIANKKPIKRVARRQYRLLQVFIYLIIPSYLIYQLFVMNAKNDTVLSLIFGFIGLTGFIISYFNIKKINRYIWKLSKKYYREKLNTTKRIRLD